MKVLSLCDGMSCGHIALDRAGIKVDEYYASEIKDIAIKVTMENYPETIQIGDVNKIHYKNGLLKTEKGIFNVGHIDLMIFGSPCQTFSVAMKKELRVGLENKEKSGLFLECYRVLKEVNPTYFMMKNVARMKDEDKDYITSLMGVEPVRINSKLVSAQLRDRLYWTNIPNVNLPEDKNIYLQDILTSGYTDRKKARALLVSDSRPLVSKDKMLRRYKITGFTTIVWEDKDDDNSIRYLNQTELERCQTVPEGYTKCLSRNEAADVLGDGWTVDVIVHLFKSLFEALESNECAEIVDQQTLFEEKEEEIMEEVKQEEMIQWNEIDNLIGKPVFDKDNDAWRILDGYKRMKKDYFVSFTDTDDFEEVDLNCTNLFRNEVLSCQN